MMKLYPGYKTRQIAENTQLQRSSTTLHWRLLIKEQDEMLFVYCCCYEYVLFVVNAYCHYTIFVNCWRKEVYI